MGAPSNQRLSENHAGPFVFQATWGYIFFKNSILSSGGQKLTAVRLLRYRSHIFSEIDFQKFIITLDVSKRYCRLISREEGCET